jgi:hypothetical protein
MQDKLPISAKERELAAGYVLGNLDPEELAQFKVLLSKKPALRAEVRALWISLSLLSQESELVTPPPHLRDRILSAYASSTVAPLRRLSWPIVLLCGLLLLALLLGLDSLRLRQELSFAQRSAPATVAALLQRPNTRLIALRSQTTDETAGTLLFTPGKWQKAAVSLNNLSPLPPDQIYRMWLTLSNGRILLCGEFKPDVAGRVFVTLSPAEALPRGAKATSVFVTYGPISAPPEPSGDRILLGKI